MNDNRKDFETNMKKGLYDLNKKYQDTLKTKVNFENECRSFGSQCTIEMEEHYKSKMHLDKSEQFAELSRLRYERDAMLSNKELTDKVEEQAQLAAEQAKVTAEYMAMGPLQDMISKEKEFRV